MLRYRRSMIDALLRRPAGRGDYAADAVRALGCLSVLAAALVLGPVNTALFLLVLLGLLVSRALAVPPVFDTVYGLTLLLGAWSSVIDLYARISWWDLAVHFISTAAIAAMTYVLLARVEAVPGVARPRGRGSAPAAVVAVLVTALGLAVSVLWELGEWWGHTLVDQRINVGYTDTMGDLSAGGLGALLAGVLLAFSARRRTGVVDPAPLPGSRAPDARTNPRR